MQRKQQGFTIIELVVVILLLGILTATALPRFMDVTDEAHDAVVSGVLGGISTGAALFRAQWYAEGQPTTPSEFAGLWANTSGHPIGVKSGTVTSTLLSTVGSTANCVEIFQGLLQLGGQPTILATTAATDLPGAVTTLTTPGAHDFVAYLNNDTTATSNVCYYFYTGQFVNPAEQAVPGISYDASSGAITVAEY